MLDRRVTHIDYAECGVASLEYGSTYQFLLPAPLALLPLANDCASSLLRSLEIVDWARWWKLVPQVHSQRE